MEIILLEKVQKLGTIGDVVKVKDGYARNFLLPRKKAVRATKSNLVHFEQQRAELEAKNAQAKSAAEQMVSKFEGVSITLNKQAGDDGRLYGSVTAREIANALKDKTGLEINHSSVVLSSKFKEVGGYEVEIQLHPEVSVKVTLMISRGDAAKSEESAA